MRCTVVDNTADRILAIIDRNKGVTVPSLAENLGSVKRVLVLNTVNRLARSDAVCIVSVFDVIKRLKLTSLFPSQSVTEILRRIALSIVFNDLDIKSSEKILPLCITVEVTISLKSSISASVARTILPSSYS